MPYVQIEDPAIIDVNSMHQIIQVVNEHSDSIAALTNNFGASSSVTEQSGKDWATTYDAGTQMIQFGRSVVTSDGSGNVSEVVSFAVDFASTPVVTATSYSNTAGNYDVNVSVRALSASGFTLEAQNAGATSTFSINWIAIGSK